MVYTTSGDATLYSEKSQNCKISSNSCIIKVINNFLQTVTINTDFCGPYGIHNYPIAGSQPLEQAPVFHSSNNRLSAIAATTALNIYTVAFVGTSQGHIKKVCMFIKFLLYTACTCFKYLVYCSLRCFGHGLVS